MNDLVEKIREIADYEFGRGTGSILFPANVRVEHSRNTGRIRYVYLAEERLATLRPTDGLFSLSIAGARRVVTYIKTAECYVAVKNTVSSIVCEGGDVFAAHVAKVGDKVRAGDEIIVLNEDRELVAVGRAVLSGLEMRSFRRGVAVKVRRGSGEER